MLQRYFFGLLAFSTKYYIDNKKKVKDWLKKNIVSDSAKPNKNKVKNYTKKEALEKLRETKELLDLGVISKEEFDNIASELKPFIL